VDQILESYPNDVRFYFCINPLAFHDRAFPAGAAVMAAGKQGKFHEYEKVLWENNRALEDADLESYAKQIGLDVEQWKKDKASAEVKGWLDHSQALANALGASGTPAFFVNGELISGAKEFDEFQKIIDRHLDKANKLVQKQIPVESLHALLSSNAGGGKYRRYVIDGKTPPKPEKQGGEEGPTEPLGKKVVEIAISDSPRRGSGDKVVMTEFADFQ
jgi:hypothetical protein